LPLFLWSREETKESEKASATNIQRRVGFRIYMRRGWFRSGKDELFAVVLQSDIDGAANEDQKLPPVPVTHWGSDPIWHDRNPIRRQPKLSDFLGAARAVTACPKPTVYDPAAPPVPLPAVIVCGVASTPCLVAARDGEILPAPVLPGEIVTGESSRDENRAADGYGPDLAPEKEIRVDVAAFAVRRDATKDLLYADVEMRNIGAYMPFVRFAVARYQENSAKYCALSPISLVDYVQANPERVISIVRSTDKHQVTAAVTVSGPGKGDDARGYQENLLKIYRILEGGTMEQYPLEVKGRWTPAVEGFEAFQWQFQLVGTSGNAYLLQELESLPGATMRVTFSQRVIL
jgi:hypothetical protein